MASREKKKGPNERGGHKGGAHHGCRCDGQGPQHRARRPRGRDHFRRLPGTLPTRLPTTFSPGSCARRSGDLLLRELQSSYPLLEGRVGAPFPPHCQVELHLHHVTAGEEQVVDLLVSSVLDGLPLARLDDALQHAYVRHAPEEHGAVGDLQVHVELVVVQLPPALLLVLGKEILNQFLLVLVHHFGLGPDPPVGEAGGHRPQLDAPEVEEAGLDGAGLVLPIVGVVNLGVGVREGDVLGYHHGVEVDLGHVVLHLRALFHQLLLERRSHQVGREDVRCFGHQRRHHLQESAGDVGREALALDDALHVRVLAPLPELEVPLAAAADPAHLPEAVGPPPPGPVVHEEAAHLVESLLAPSYCHRPVPREELRHHFGVGVIIICHTLDCPVPVLAGGEEYLAGFVIR
mmetsp:Transcript_61264/g.172740  ORF Transcript_61264/g.172740 Transcript_61264/m.172740 type:complete len:404 (+) Transcript_61264:159-1370(+)